MDSTDYLSRKGRGLLCGTVCCLYFHTALDEDLVRLFPQLLGNDCRDDLTRLVLEHHPFVLRQEFLLFCPVIDDLDLVSAVVAFVLRVLYDAADRVVVYQLARSAAVAFVPQQLLNVAQTVIAGCVGLVYQLHHFGFLLVDDKFAVILVVAEDAGIADDVSVLDSLAMTEFHTLGKLAHLVLRYARHDRKPKLAVRLYRADIVRHEEYTHSMFQQVAGVCQTVYGVARKTADFFRQNKIKFAVISVLYHALELYTVLGVLAAYAVCVAFHIFPVRVALYHLAEVAFLVLYRHRLLVAGGRYPGVVCHAQVEVFYLLALGAHTVYYFVDVHDGTPLVWL